MKADLNPAMAHLQLRQLQTKILQSYNKKVMDASTTDIKIILSALLQDDYCQCTDCNFRAAIHALRHMKKGASELQKARDDDPGLACEPAELLNNPGPTGDPLKNPGPAHESLNSIEVVESYISAMCYSRPDNDLLLRDIKKTSTL